MWKCSDCSFTTTLSDEIAEHLDRRDHSDCQWIPRAK